MRPTCLEFRSPKEKTPDFYSPKVNCVGKSLGFVNGSGSKTFSQSRRFQQYEVDAKRTPCRVGPGCYDSCKLELTKPSIGAPIYKKLQIGQDTSINGYFYTGNHLVFDKAFVRKSRRSSTHSLFSSTTSKKPTQHKKKNPSLSSQIPKPNPKPKPKKRPSSAKPRPY